MVSKLPNYVSLSDNISIDLKREVELINPDKIVVLVDENTKKNCLPLLEIDNLTIIEIKSGELNKTLATCNFIWDKLTRLGCSRKSLLVNLGGGVIGDMGGFCAATFKRGIPFINVPTTLLSQVDASIGGKLGVDFNELKNHIGLFKEPNKVIIHSGFLKTLTQRELKSGFAEIIKHALIFDIDHWSHLKETPFERLDWEALIKVSVAIKNTIVEKDPFESGLRKILNFGHTLGHAIESHFLKSENPLLHGEAVAVGMILESHISNQKGMLEENEFIEVQQLLSHFYSLPEKLPEIAILMSYLIQDKKNSDGRLNFSLINKIGECQYDNEVSEIEIENSLNSYSAR